MGIIKLVYKNENIYIRYKSICEFHLVCISILTNNKYKNHNHYNNSYNAKTNGENLTICIKNNFSVHSIIIIILLVKKVKEYLYIVIQNPQINL